MNKLNQSQQDAVFHKQGPLLVLAGAGTGKTRVLTSRIINIVNSYLATSHQILAVTFTNKAATEMKNRIANEIGDEINNIWAGTFHSIANRILRRHPEIVGLHANFTIIDPDDQIRLIKQVITSLNIDHREFPAKNYLYKIERFKDKSLLPEDLKNSDSNQDPLPKLKKVYESYQQRLLDLNVADFGDLLLYNLKIFNQKPEVLEYYQNKFHYILVDEFQDTNNVQYQWLLKLAAKYQNICAVGDDDQSIYSWRGAQIANILKFEKDFENTKIIRLERNYRSKGNILKLASQIIKNNSKRHEKTLWTESQDGEKIKLLSFIDDRDEALNIAAIIKNLQKNSRLNDIAILVRAGYQTRSFEESFIQNSIPYRIVGGLRFYERREVKDCIAYLRTIYSFNDDLALARIINLPKRGVGKNTLDNLSEKSRNENLSLFIAIKKSLELGSLKGKAKDSLRILVENIEKWQDLAKEQDLISLAKNVLNESGYLKMWQNEKTPDAAGRVENIKEFLNSLEDFENLEIFLDHVSLVSNNDAKPSENDMVNIMTIHAAKGLEFETIFIPGLEEGVFPSSRSSEEKNGIEEERRLFYVAITRAKERLYLTYAQNRVIFGNFQVSIMSRFLKEVPEELLESDHDGFHSSYSSHLNDLQSNETETEGVILHKRIFHQKFGYGKVVSQDGNKLKIIFEKTGEKTVIKDFVEMA